jgi:rubrerythrin
MMSQIPLRIGNSRKNSQMLRSAMIAELDAVNLYEQMADNTNDKAMKRVLLNIAKEEKTHFGEFLDVLEMHDKQALMEILNGKKEVSKLKKVI